MTTADVERKLAERYGRTASRVRRRVGWTLVAVLAVGLTALLGWSVVSQAMGSADADTTGYEVVDEHTVTVRFQVAVTPGTPVACALEAQDEDHGIVGWKVVEYPAADARTRVFEESIPTVAEATTGLVQSCWIP